MSSGRGRALPSSPRPREPRAWALREPVAGAARSKSAQCRERVTAPGYCPRGPIRTVITARRHPSVRCVCSRPLWRRAT